MGKGPPDSATIFRAQRLNAKHPRIGSPESVQPGDWLTFFVESRFTTREVASCHKGYVLTAPLKSEYGVLDGPRKVKFENFYDAVRIDQKPPEETAPAQEEATKPAPKKPSRAPRAPKSKENRKVSKDPPKPRAKKSEQAKKATPPPKDPPKRRRRRKRKKPPPEWLDFLADEQGR